jgi:hypothetical protein
MATMSSLGIKVLIEETAVRETIAVASCEIKSKCISLLN